ncbi:MAG: GH3 auxin-responsive promoter family protein [Planctomycetota bacterium]
MLQSERRFAAALSNPGEIQQRLLFNILKHQRETVFGREHGFSSIQNYGDYVSRVPIADYESHQPLIERVRLGEEDVLTADPVTHLIPTSGSSGPRKLIPHTVSLQSQFNAALGPWVRSMFRRFPGATQGRTYWSVSPAIDEDAASAVKVGFEDDTDYLGPLGRMLVRRILAVPSSVRKISDIDAFWNATALHLLAVKDLSLVSVWHPSFLMRLLDEIDSRWYDLIDQLPRHRARQLSRTTPDAICEIWPRLSLVSAWADASAALPFDRMRERLSGVEAQAKGLLASECWTTFPYEGMYPLAVTSHVFEFLDEHGRVTLCDELQLDEVYETVVTTAGGLYRYRTGDKVRVTGFLKNTPTLQFIGRDRAASDLCGEKLTESHVSACLSGVYSQTGYRPTDQALIPADSSAPTYYILLLTSNQPPPADFGQLLDDHLGENPHYALARRLGQLQPLQVHWAAKPFRDLGSESHVTLGSIKPSLLVSHEMLSAYTASKSSL